ncbi:hypothetical protein P3W85_33915, partial [Cupriavidus basilensis]
MWLAGRERHPQRLASAKQVLLADHLVDIARTQALGQGLLGTIGRFGKQRVRHGNQAFMSGQARTERSAAP